MTEALLDSEEEHFTEEESKQFVALINVGKVHRTLDVFGNKVTVATLSTEDELNVGLLVKKFVGAPSYTRAFQTAMVAAAVKEVNGRPLVLNLEVSQDENDLLHKKWNILGGYHGMVIDEIYRQFVAFEKEVLDPLASRLGKSD